MSAATKSVKYKLEADPSGFKAGYAAARKEADGFVEDLGAKTGKLHSILSAMGPAGTAAAAGIGLFVGAMTLAANVTIDATKHAAAYSDNLMAQQERTMMSVSALQKMEVAAKLGNGSLEGLAAASDKVQTALQNGDTAFAKLNLSVERLKNESPDGALRDFARALQDIHDPAERAAARQDLLGRSAGALQASLNALTSSASDLGGELDGESVAAAANFQDKLDLLDTALERVELQFGAAIAKSPELAGAIEDVTEAVVGLAEGIAENRDTLAFLFDALGNGVGQVPTIIRGIKRQGDIAVAASDVLTGRERSGPNVARGQGGIFDPASIGTAGPAGDAAARLLASQITESEAAFRKQDAAAKKVADAELARIELVRKARIEEQQTRVKLQDEADKRQQLSLQNEIKFAEQRVEARQREQDELEAEEDRRIEQEERIAEATANRRKIEAEEHRQHITDLSAVAAGLDRMGDAAGGAFGTILGLGAGSIDVFTNLDKKTRDSMTGLQKWAGVANAAAAIMSGPGGAKGALSGGMAGASAGAAFGPWGAAIGGGLGAIGGALFGGPSEADRRAQSDRAREAGLTSSEIQRLSGDFERFGKQLDVLQKQSGVLESLASKLDAIRMDRTERGIAGLTAQFQHMTNEAKLSASELARVDERMDRFADKLKKAGVEGADFDKAMRARRNALQSGAEGADLEEQQARMNRLSLFAAAMFQDLKNQGLSTSEAFEKMGPAIDAAIEAAKAHGVEIGGTLGMLAEFQQKVAASPELARAAESWGDIVNAMRSSGSLDQTGANAVMEEMAAQVQELTEKGFTEAQQSALMAQGLMALRDAAAAGTIALDDQTRAMIERAEAQGAFEGLEDPMKEQLEVQRLMLEAIAALTVAFGKTLPESVQKYIDKLNDIPNVGGPTGYEGSGGARPPRDEGLDSPGTGYATGYYNESMPPGPLPGGGTPMTVHPGEEVSVIPRGGRRSGNTGITGGGWGGEGGINIVVQNVWDGRVVDEHHVEGLRNNRSGMATETRRHAGTRLGM